MDTKAFDLYAPAIVQGALSGNPTIVYGTAEQQASFINGCQKLLEAVLLKRDQLANSSATNALTT